MSNASKSSSSSSSTSRRSLLSKMFQRPASTQTHPYPHPSSSGRESESTLVTPQSQSSTKKDGQRDPDAVFGALASTYGWGSVHVPALPSDPTAPGKSKKKPAVKPTAARQDAAAVPAPSTPHQPLRRPLTQAQREQAIVDLSSKYSLSSPLPGGRWGM